MATLRLTWQPDGPRYFLDDAPVHAGDTLEARMDDGAWTAVRFEYHWDRIANTVEPYLIQSGPDGDNHLLPDHTECRWPAADDVS